MATGGWVSRVKTRQAMGKGKLQLRPLSGCFWQMACSKRGVRGLFNAVSRFWLFLAVAFILAYIWAKGVPLQCRKSQGAYHSEKV